jgi:hypothetical protein
VHGASPPPPPPEYYDGDETTRVLQPEEFPHDWQLIFLGALSPVAVDNSGPAAPLTIPTDTPLLGAEYTMTPPPNFSLNSLLNGELGWLLGSVYNGRYGMPGAWLCGAPVGGTCCLLLGTPVPGHGVSCPPSRAPSTLCLSEHTA